MPGTLKVSLLWALEPGTHHLNHGSFGAVLDEVIELQSEWRKRLEANPNKFVFRDLKPAIDRAREAPAEFVGADAALLVPVRNATTGVASVLRSLEPLLEPGDQLLTTAHDYNAVRQSLRFTAERVGAEVVVARVPFPIEGPDHANDGRAVRCRLRRSRDEPAGMAPSAPSSLRPLQHP